MNKLRFLFLIFLAGFAAIAVRLFYIQVLRPEFYTADYTRTSKIEPNRGRILDRNHEPIAINQTKYRLFVEPQKIEDRDYLIKVLDDELEIGEATLEARINMSKNLVAIQGNVSKQKKETIEKLKLEELGFENEQQRFYPEASLAAHLVGFLGKNSNGDSIGYFGVEGYYDKDLTGLPGVLKSERDMFGRPIFSGSQKRIEAADGRDIVLTIDKSVQHIMKEHLKKGVEQFHAKSGCVIAVNPSTMEILGLVCLPDFDPEYYYEFTESDFSNWSISSVYEPGSTFKPMIMAAAIEEGAVEPIDLFNEKGPVEIGGYTIRNWNDKYEGKITITHILEKSSNVGMVYIGDKLGKENLYKYINLYGFGSPTQIDLQGETSGKVKPLSSWYPIDTATMAFGQGISVTGMQLVRAFASLINGGYLMRPYVVKEVIEGDTVKVREPQIQKQVLSKQTSKIMKKMLSSVINNAEVRWNMPKGYTFGGKTGTAQIAVEGTYDVSKTIASFIGFAPADNPAFLMLVVIQEPESSSWGSETAAPLFFEIAEDLLIYLNVQPS
ncbi:MAG: Peptidoglycan glycosyltransferase [Candidatus Roizmanbacteria bacterium GW2011_GWA2_37_7]|uniref:Peptidoglycan glycosyltransferase n=1 Tax=Candidatus Roizmanbacteria bacterium GW2011_GWA2_37_7 TaxID=1618481 RepID=A0A0G0H956_9BACT|nr:MAG: Peptidoglycan glycosyltransferase [Candidatus Roizmanbacteria bacterium GW2011_GWA2_37_7]